MSSVTKRASEKKRREAINTKIEELKSLVFNSPESSLHQHEVLNQVVAVVTGGTPSTSSSGTGPIRTTRLEKKKDAEQLRRDKQGAAFDILKQFIIDHQLPGHSGKLDRVAILDIIISYLRGLTSADSLGGSSDDAANIDSSTTALTTHRTPSASTDAQSPAPTESLNATNAPSTSEEPEDSDVELPLANDAQVVAEPLQPLPALPQLPQLPINPLPALPIIPFVFPPVLPMLHYFQYLALLNPIQFPFFQVPAPVQQLPTEESEEEEGENSFVDVG